ncbi:MAG: laminin B domain-containing protein [Phycisphaerales bacterium]
MKVSLSGLMMAAFVSAATAGGEGVSTFDTDSEGWSTDKDAQSFMWESEGGNPGGFISAVDIGSGEYWRFDAPASFLGDRSAAYGQSISYDIIQLGSVGTVTNRPDIRLASGGVVLEYEFGVAPTGAWSSFSVPIDESAGWTINGLLASESQIVLVLSNLTEFSIRGEYRVGADSAGLDNVQFGEVCQADFNADGSVNFFDISDFIAAFNAGNAAADLVEPFGSLNFFDISAFIDVFNAGCP